MYRVLSRHLAGVMKSSMGMNSGGIFSIFLSLFFSLSLYMSSLLVSTFFFFSGSALKQRGAPGLCYQGNQISSVRHTYWMSSTYLKGADVCSVSTMFDHGLCLVWQCSSTQMLSNKMLQFILNPSVPYSRLTQRWGLDVRFNRQMLQAAHDNGNPLQSFPCKDQRQVNQLNSQST